MNNSLSVRGEASCGAVSKSFSCPSHVPGEPGLLMPGLHLPSAQPQDVAALSAGNHVPGPSLTAMPDPWSPGLTLHFFTLLRAKMGMGSLQLSTRELSGHPPPPPPQLLLPPPAAPPSSQLLTRRPQSREPCTQSSMAFSRFSAGLWQPCATLLQMSARFCWIRYQPPPHTPLGAWQPALNLGLRCTVLTLEGCQHADSRVCLPCLAVPGSC